MCEVMDWEIKEDNFLLYSDYESVYTCLRVLVRNQSFSSDLVIF